jgi:glycosyltransferase involved in cell wall biosynthesis
MHLALVGPTYPFRGGIAHYTTMLAQNLQIHGHQVDLCSFQSGYLRAWYPGQTDRDPSTQPLRAAAQYLLHPLRPWTWLSTARWIAARKPDLAVIEWWVPFWAPPLLCLAVALRRSGVPVVMDCQNVLPHERHPFDQALTALTLRQANVCLVYSPAHRAELAAVVPGMPVALVPFPAYTALARTVPDRAAARKTLALPDGPLALFFGFVRPYKGLPVLIEAFARAVQQVPLHLVIAGEFWDDPATYLQQLAAHHLETHTTVVNRYLPDDELALYLAAADVIVMPYLAPVQSGVLALAQAFYRPVIASQVGGLQEGIRPEQTGLLVPPNDPAALAQALVRFVSEDLGTVMAPYLAASQPERSWQPVLTALQDLVTLTRHPLPAGWSARYGEGEPHQ